MSLSQTVFNANIAEIELLSNKVAEQCRWIVCTDRFDKEIQFLVKKNDVHELPPNSDESAADDDVDSSPRHVVFEWHIVYHQSFAAPAIYFNVAELDGTPIAYDHLHACLPANNSVPLPFITQTSHPVLDTPFWHIHPCETTNAMKLTSVGGAQTEHSDASSTDCSEINLSDNYVAVWMTLYAAPLGLQTASCKHFIAS